MSKIHKFSSKICTFAMEGGWHFVAVPVNMTSTTSGKNKWRFQRIQAQIGKTRWETSLLPLGKSTVIKGQKFIAIKKDVRKKESLNAGDEVTVKFKLL